MNAKLRCAIYSRYSTDKQNESSIVDQERVCDDYAARQGWQVIERYSDASISGAAMGNRPGFLRMRADATAHRFDVLLLTDTTRLCRSGDLQPLVERLRFQGVRVVGVQDQFDSTTGFSDLQASMSGAMSIEFRRMIKARTYAALETRAKEKRPTGGRAYGYHCANASRTVDAQQAEIVRRIFERFAQGASCRTIAHELNEAKVPSPGSTWNRKKRRCDGWAGSAVRVILANPLYAGTVRWNASNWVRDPDTGERDYRERPRSEWHEHQDEALRIVSDQLWKAAQARSKARSSDSPSLKRGGKARYLLSGLLKCGVCGRNFTGWGATHYRCGGYIDGRACTNSLGTERRYCEKQILKPVLDELLEPSRVAMLALEFQREVETRLRAKTERAAEVPAELKELDERIARLQKRLATGDPDLTTDELQAAITTARAKRQALVEAQPTARMTARIARIVPDAAKRYRTAIERAMTGGDAATTAEAREMIRAGVLLEGEIKLVPEGGKLYADYALTIRPELVHQRLALQRATGTDGAYFVENKELGTVGSGGRI